MTNNQFIELLHSELNSYIIVLIFILIFYYFMFGRNITHIADPLAIGYVSQAFSCSVVIFIFLEDRLDDDYFFSFLFTELAFLLPLVFMGAKYKMCYAEKISNASLAKEWEANYSIFYSTTLIIFIITTIIYFLLAGIPVLNQVSRLDTNESLGALSWFTDIYWICLPSLVIIKRYVFLRRRTTDYILISLCFLCLLAKGGKSDFFFMIISLFLVKEIFQIRGLDKVVNYLSYISPLVIISLMVIIFSVWNSKDSVLSAFFERFVLFGDVFYHGYSKDFMQSLPDNIYLWDYFFGGTINKIRSLLGMPIKEKVVFGYEISKYYYNISSGIGPNARHNILGLYLLGPYISIIFSFLFGLAYLFIRSGKCLINKSTSRYSLRVFFYVMSITYSCFFFVDPSLLLGFYLKILAVFSLPLLLSILKKCLLYYIANKSQCTHAVGNEDVIK